MFSLICRSCHASLSCSSLASSIVDFPSQAFFPDSSSPPALRSMHLSGFVGTATMTSWTRGVYNSVFPKKDVDLYLVCSALACVRKAQRTVDERHAPPGRHRRGAVPVQRRRPRKVREPRGVCSVSVRARGRNQYQQNIDICHKSSAILLSVVITNSAACHCPYSANPEDHCCRSFNSWRDRGSAFKTTQEV